MQEEGRKLVREYQDTDERPAPPTEDCPTYT